MKTLAILIALASMAFAVEPLKLDRLKIGTREYTGASVTLESRIFAKVRHDSGFIRVQVIDLPEEIRARLGLDEKISPVAVKEYTIRSYAIDSPEFIAVFNAVHQVQDSAFIFRPLSVVQTVGGGITLAMIDDDSYEIVMILGDFKERADGDKFSTYLEYTGQMKEYVSVLGAKKKVRAYRIPVLLSPLGLQTAIKNGGSYEMDYGTTSAPCPRCEGKPVYCEHCGSTGKITVPQPVRVKW